MKPSAAKPGNTAATPKPTASEAPRVSTTDATTPGVPAAQAGVTEELNTIDTAPLERLLEIRKEATRLEEFRARAEQKKESVSEVVWRRVVSDYTQREAALDEQAAPLRAQVRTEYQKLRALLDRTKERHDAAVVEKSELEFRHEVGELTQKQLDDRLREPQKVLDQCAVDLAAIEAQKSRFLAAFSSEQEIELPPPPVKKQEAAAPRPVSTPAPPPPPPPPPAPAEPEPIEEAATMLAPNPLLKGSKPPAPPPPPPPSAPDPMEEAATMLAPNPLLKSPPPAMPAGEDATMLAPNPLMAGSFAAESDATMLAPNPLFKAPAPPPPPAPAIESDATFVVTPEQLEAMKKAAADAEAARQAEQADERTFMLPVAWLLVNSDSPAPSEYRLAASNSLGRADDSHVMIARPGVSRKHAVIVANTSGFTLQDLGSQNGTFVNGQRVKEHPLKDGDQILIGDTKIVFKTQYSGQSR